MCLGGCWLEIMEFGYTIPKSLLEVSIATIVCIWHWKDHALPCHVEERWAKVVNQTLQLLFLLWNINHGPLFTTQSAIFVCICLKAFAKATHSKVGFIVAHSLFNLLESFYWLPPYHATLPLLCFGWVFTCCMGDLASNLPYCICLMISIYFPKFALYIAGKTKERRSKPLLQSKSTHEDPRTTLQLP